VQETFLKAYKQLHRFDGRSAFGTWLYRIAANCSLDLIRARKNRREQQASADSENSGEKRDWLEQVAAPDPSPERLARSGQVASLLKPALEQLTDLERTAFVLRHYEGCGIAEIASALGVETNAAKHSVFRAVQKLRRALEPVAEVAQ
jgi:RNA polymerase sigma-70 factor, ECF subfamily